MDDAHKSSPGVADAKNSRNQAAKDRQDVYSWRFTTGLVLRSNVGTYDFLVRLSDNNKEIACRSMADTVGSVTGAKDITIIAESSSVLMFLPSKDAEFGIIMGAVPAALHGKAGGADFAPMYYQANPESAAALWSDSIFKTPVFDQNNVQKLMCNENRPPDVLAGDWGKINEFGVLIGMFGLSAVLRASHMASVEVNNLDDLVRIASGQFQHYHAMGETQIFNDGGHATMEYAGSFHQPEIAGEDSYSTGDTGIFTHVEEADESYKDAMFRMDQADRTPKRRFSFYAGNLADGAQMFFCNPEEGTETYSRESKHQGLVQAGVSAGGRVFMRTAGGISLMHYDRIPIPKRLLESWDPDGDKVEDEDPFEAKTPFVFSESDPYGRNMEMRDATAYRLGKQYQRFDEVPNDFYTPEETDLGIPDDIYDRPKQSKEDYQKNDKQYAGIHIEDDGSVIIRDAWGSEIAMRGGNIIISCAGDVTQQPGKSAVILGGKDVIIKGRNSVDISASEKDVRVAAKGNVHVYSEEKGILLESDAESTGHGFFEDADGEVAQSKGIILKAKEATVFLWGKNTHVSAEKDVIIETVDRDAGRVFTSTGSVLTAAKNVFLEAEGKATLILRSFGAMLSGSLAILAGDRSAFVTKDSKVMVPLQWADIDSNPAETVLDAAKDLDEDFREEDDWLGQYKAEDRQPIKFTFRTTPQYGTNSAREVEGASAFKIYQTPWQFMAEEGAENVPVSLTPWEELEKDGTQPWPGYDAYNAAVWYKLASETNVDADGLTIVNRQSLSDTSGGFTPRSFDEYNTVNT